MIVLLATFGVCIVSALIPLVNAEAYLVAVAASTDNVNLWLVCSVAAVGQMVGKVIWYEAGRRSMDWSWIRKRMARPKRQRQLTLWQERVQGRPFFSAVVVFASAFVGIPPFAVMSVLAGQLKMSFPVFLVTGLVGRALRFGLIVQGISMIHFG
ncbi:MAG: hypothetical protein GEU96_12355 [Propionibacteriales bacterium]|nr:hypothetical protein [Propionibacteriales bacterium]